MLGKLNANGELVQGGNVANFTTKYTLPADDLKPRLLKSRLVFILLVLSVKEVESVEYIPIQDGILV